MALARDPGPVEGVRLQAVASPQAHADFVSVTERAYEHAMTAEVTRAIFSESSVLHGPNVRAFVALHGDTPLAAAMVTVYAGLGEVGFVGTVPEARGRGLGLAVTQACAHHAFNAGARLVYLQASVMGEPVYRKLGFVELTRYVKFELPVS
jgi:ribosomal protein S18 acetylase RimI-like enzyme